MNSVNNSRLNDSSSFNSGKKKKTMEDYELIKSPDGKSELGHGSYGCVKLARDKATGELVAIKIMTKKSIFEYSNKTNLRREINIQRSINHPHIIKLFNYFEDSENVYLILEYAENGSLFQLLRRSQAFREEEAFVYFFQTCLGIDYLHKKNIIHRDLKPENLLLDAEFNVKLCDFGWSAEDSKIRSTFCGTIDYMAPEMIKNEPHDYRLDIWCLGILLYEMLHGHAPFRGKNEREKTNNIMKFNLISFNQNISPEAVDLIKRILKPSPYERISMDQIFNHPWMRKFESYFGTNLNDFIAQADDDVSTFKGSIESNNNNQGSYGSNSTAKLGSYNETTTPTTLYSDPNTQYKLSNARNLELEYPTKEEKPVNQKNLKINWTSDSKVYNTNLNYNETPRYGRSPDYFNTNSNYSNEGPSLNPVEKIEDFRSRPYNKTKTQYLEPQNSVGKNFLYEISNQKLARSHSQDIYGNSYEQQPKKQTSAIKSSQINKHNIDEMDEFKEVRMSKISKKNKFIQPNTNENNSSDDL